jgi:uncharacterized membrane protein YfhO
MGAVLGVMLVILVSANFAILLYVIFSYTYRVFLLFARYGTVYIHVYCSYYYHLEFIGFISYSYNVFLPKVSVEDPADPGSLCSSEPV